MPKVFFYILLFLSLAGTFSSFKISEVQTNSLFRPKNLQCNITHLEFQNEVGWAKGDLFNKTFIKINKNSQTLSDITWKVNDTLAYMISNIEFEFKVLSQNQTAEIIGKDSVLIEGTFAEVLVNFTFTKTEGGQDKVYKAAAKGISEELMVALKFDVNSGSFQQKYLDSMEYYQAQLTVISVDKWMSPEEKDDLISLLNKREDKGVTLKQNLNQYINSLYVPAIKLFLQEENQRTGPNFSYTWRNIWTNKSYTINFTRNPQQFYSDKSGVNYEYEMIIDDYKNTRCGPVPTKSPYNLSMQEQVSWTFIENLFNVAMQRQIISTDLNFQSWGKYTNFSYKAQQAYQIIYNTSQFAPDSPVTGHCKGNPSATRFWSSDDYFSDMNITIGYDCQLWIQNKTVLKLYVEINLSVRADNFYNDSQITFDIHGVQYKIRLIEVPGFLVYDKSKLDNIVRNHVYILARLQKMFATDFPRYLKFTRLRSTPKKSSFIYYQDS